MLTTLSVHAEPQRISVRYRASRTCPTFEDFAREVGRRSERLQLAEVTSAESTVDTVVTLAQDETTFGQVQFGSSRPRTLTADTCAEAASALSFILALAYDPDAKPPEPLVGDAGASTGASVDAGVVPPVVLPSASSSASSTRAPLATKEPLAPAQPHQGEPRPTPHTWGFGFLAEVSSLAGPTFQGRLFGSLAWEPPSILAPALRLSFSRSLRSVIEANAQRGVLTFSAVELEACPLRYPSSDSNTRARVCAWGSVGWIDSEGRVANVRSDVRPWVAAGISVPIAFALSQGLALEVRPALGRSLLLDRYFVEPNTTVFEQPLLYGQIGVGLHGRLRSE